MGLEIPLVNMPGEYGSYKIVQFYIDNKAYLRFGEKGTDFHKYIITRFCNEFKKDVEFLKEKEEMPKLKTSWYEVCGMGRCWIDIDSEIIFKNDPSFEYGLGLNLEHLDLIKKLYPNRDIKIN